MTTTDKTLQMLKNIDSNLDRTMQIVSLEYDKETLRHIIKSGYVTVIGKKVTRKYHGKNYHLYI